MPYTCMVEAFVAKDTLFNTSYVKSFKLTSHLKTLEQVVQKFLLIVIYIESAKY